MIVGENGCTDTFAKYEALVSSLPATQGLWNYTYRKYNGFWYPEHLMAPTLIMRDTFVARPTDVILATIPKSGATWLKALAFCVVHRGRHAPTNERHPLLVSSPHELVPFLHSVHENYRSGPPDLLLEEMPSPRVLALHTPFSALPASVQESGCRVVYLCRDPKDVFVSLHHYLNEIKPARFAMTPFAESFDLFCNGVSGFGPVWDHMAEYWKESVARTEEVMFLRYEHLKEDTVGCMMRLAEFLGCPFTDEERASCVPEAVVAMCSMERMKSVEANQVGEHGAGEFTFRNSVFFRKGEVGDWKAHMTADMARRLDGIVEEKLRGSGLSLTGN
ncbi:cytosolic sulfotransferase 5-like [Phragmites australis]|uniref:cytosolic sulfotransferase 5-like n=1 Tax=Phragmites australis TaxID=29695 RepID=UPI002D76C6CA|nr:cytosolic sulfotransferase 5-like [Phragmites australis]